MVRKPPITLLALLLLILSACQNKDAGSQAISNPATAEFDPVKQIKIAAIYSLTGVDAVNNERGFNGTRMAVEEINSQGGLLNKTIHLEIYDDESSAAGARKCAEKAVSDSCLAVLGCTYSSNAMVVAPVLQQFKIPFIPHIATNPGVTAAGDYIFRACFINSYQSRLLAKFVFSDLQKKSAAIIYEENNPYSIDLKDEFTAAFQQSGGKITKEVSYKKEDTDFSKQLISLNQSEASVLFIPSYAAKSGMIIRQASKIGLKSIFLGGDGWTDDRIIKYADSTAAGSFFADHWDNGINSPKNRKFIAAYTAKYGSVKPVNSDAVLAYDAVYLLADAIKKAHSFNRQKIRDQLAVINFDGITGKISFDEFRNPQKQLIIKKVGRKDVSFYKSVEP